MRPSVSIINDLSTNVIRNLRLVNHLQHIDVSIPITYRQLRINLEFFFIFNFIVYIDLN